ncbi:Ig-like domain-containing protein [Aldersonia sp. NBC_00410]|uniref:Ig-like domain-containing protein n=1 Tax=Aldersonia sp. NBC_00410 TaxID=2975954 RepID=UPI0022530271|nr:Ig-like domain-containing protein [Aldersonia sp. NBC_00410]MCX5043597.1 Ig-like domain-containing protein [Aldersonia sp. NBC_00410]
MSHAPMRRAVAVLAAAGIATGGLLFAVPASAATTNTDFTAACWGKFKSLLDTTDKTIAAGVTVDAPATVITGDTFTYRLQPKAQTLPGKGENLRNRSSVSRIKFDYAVPEGAQFVSATVVPGTAVNLAGKAPTVVRVAENGSPDAAGPVLRLSGGNETVGNGPSTNDGAEGGIVVNISGDTSFRLPAIEVTAVAGPVGSVVQPKVRTAGNAANYKADENFYTSLIREKDPVAGVSYWSATRCSPRDSSGAALNSGAGALASINVVARPDTATTTTLATPATADNGVSVDLTATVSPATVGGSVQFKDGDANLGAPVALTNGTATLPHIFDTDGAHSVTAVYLGASGVTGSTSAASVVTVSTPVQDTTTTLTTPSHATTGVAVSIAATVDPAPAGGTVQFFDGTTAIGDPVAVSGSVATLAHEFATAGTQSITATFNGVKGFAASTAAARTIEVSVPAPDEVRTTITLDAPATAITGQAVALNATVTPGQAGGSVQFFDGTTAIGSPVPVTGGTATLTHSFATVGAHGVTAVYSGAAGVLGSSSDASVVNVSEPTGPPVGGTGSAG